jgi:hypothetical protein
MKNIEPAVENDTAHAPEGEHVREVHAERSNGAAAVGGRAGADAT